MKLEERTVELIQADIDGELAGSDRAELSAALLANPAARQLHDELRTICAALDVDATGGTAGGVARPDHGRVAAASGADHRSTRRSARRRILSTIAPVALRYAAAFAGGMLVSALAFQVDFDPGRAESGTTERHDGTRPVGSRQLQPQDRSGQRTAARSACTERRRRPCIQARLAARPDIQVVARLEGQEIRLAGFDAQGKNPWSWVGAFNARSECHEPVLVKSGSRRQDDRRGAAKQHT